MTLEEGVAPSCFGLDTFYCDARLKKKISVKITNESKGQNRCSVLLCFVIIEEISHH